MTDTLTAAADLVAALGAMDELPRGKTAHVKSDKGNYSYNYADLGSVLGHVRPILAAHRLAVVQPVESAGGQLHVATVLVHASGERFLSPPLTIQQPPKPQDLGSAITYLRRYSLLAALGLATEDDDGAAASAPAPRPARAVADRTAKPAARSAAPATIKTPREALGRAVHAMFNQHGYGGDENRDRRLAYTARIIGREIGSSTELTDDELRVVADALRAAPTPTPTEQWLDQPTTDAQAAEWRVAWSERLDTAEVAGDLGAITKLGNEAVAAADAPLAEAAREAYERVRRAAQAQAVIAEQHQYEQRHGGTARD